MLTRVNFIQRINEQGSVVQRAIEVLKMLCRWLAVLVLAGFLLVIEAIAISQGTLKFHVRIFRMFQQAFYKSPNIVEEKLAVFLREHSR